MFPFFLVDFCTQRHIDRPYVCRVSGGLTIPCRHQLSFIHVLEGLVMAVPDRTSPRKRLLSARAVRAALLVVAGVVSSLLVVGAQPGKEKPAGNPDAVLKRLLDGNQRFVEGRLQHPGRTPKDFLALAEGQKPVAVILGCADSRVPPEVVFDQGVGDLFVVRVAGNVAKGAGPTVKGSIEFAVAELGARLIVVLGHSQCGAVKAAIEHIEASDQLPGAIGPLIDPIRPAVIAAKGKPGDKLSNVIRAHVMQGVKGLETLDPILSKFAKTGELKVVGASYDLSTGKVEVFK
jgi:carbonic anhydrase